MSLTTKQKQKYSVCWVPNIHTQNKYETINDLLSAGGREVFPKLVQENAEEMRRYLEIGAPKDGEYVVISV